MKDKGSNQEKYHMHFYDKIIPDNDWRTRETLSCQSVSRSLHGLNYSQTKASPSSELACTSVVASVLAELFSSPADNLKFQWYHQLDVAAGRVDIILATACRAGVIYTHVTRMRCPMISTLSPRECSLAPLLPCTLARYLSVALLLTPFPLRQVIMGRPAID